MINLKHIGVAAGCFLATFAWAADNLGTTPTTSQLGNIGGNAILNVQGQNVVDANGQTIGKIEHILLSPGGCVDMALLSTGQGLLGQGNFVAVPWQLVTFQGGSTAGGGSAQGTTFHVKVDRAKLQKAPKFNRTQIQNINQQQNIIQQVYNYYGVQPQSGQGGTGSSQDTIGGTGQDQQSSLTNRAGTGTSTNLTNLTNQTQRGVGGTSTTATNDVERGTGSSTGLPPSSRQGTTGSDALTNDTRNLPPGLEKRDTLPPGLEKRETLPPGLEKRNGSNPGVPPSNNPNEDKGQQPQQGR